MKKILALILLFILLCGTAIAETWYPFGLTREDDYQAALEKMKTVLKNENVVIRSNNMSCSPLYLNLYEIGIENVVLNQPSVKWRLVLMTKGIAQAEYDIEKLYEIYSMLLEKLGEPVSVSPTIQTLTFDGITEKNPFETKESFIEELTNANSKAEYTVEFENCTFRISVYDFYTIKAYLSFDNPFDAQ